jgi:hypothetical protein
MTLIIDSGAYSAWRQGKPIDIDVYCDFLLNNLDWIEVYVALDVINPADPEQAAADSYKNYLHMRKRGLDPMPVWHVKEDVSWLHRMLDVGCTYIGLSASSLVSRNEVDAWYAAAWDNLVTADGSPIIKAHAFGEGRYASLIKFPFYSADTTSWIYAAQRSAKIRIDDKRGINVRRDLKSDSTNRNIDDLSVFDGAVFDELLHKFGIDKRSLQAGGDIKVNYVLTTFLTMLYYLDVETRIRQKCPIKFHRPGFVKTGSSAPAVAFPSFNLHFVLGGNPSATAVAHWLQAENRLVSYFQMQGKTQAENRMHLMVRDMVKDPANAMQKWPRIGQYYDILEKYVTKGPFSDAEQRTRFQAASI